MGNASAKEKKSFGSIYSDDNPRPGYYFNKNKLFYQNKEIPLYPGETEFKKLKFGYCKTNVRVFYQGREIFANPKTFILLNRNNVKDHNKNLVKYDSVIGMDFNGNTKRFYHKGIIVNEEI